MAGHIHPADHTRAAGASDQRVTTLISCPGVTPLRHDSTVSALGVANENHWYDRIGLRRRFYANMAAGLLTIALLLGGIWIVTEFARLQKIAACVEAGRQNCMPLDLARRAR